MPTTKTKGTKSSNPNEQVLPRELIFEGFSVDDKIKIYYGPNNINNNTYSIRAFVDYKVVVLKSRIGHYVIWDKYYFDRLKPYMKKVSKKA
jgi:hypothetical protein